MKSCARVLNEKEERCATFGVFALLLFGNFGDALALALGGFDIGDDLAILEETCYMLEILFMMP